MSTNELRVVVPFIEARRWHQRIAALDLEFFTSVRPSGTGIALDHYGYSLCPEDMWDSDSISFCEPPPPELAYVLCWYMLERTREAWSYLRFWTRSLRLGGTLVLFTNPRFREWADRYSCWELDAILEDLGFSAPFPRRTMEHGFGHVIVATKERQPPEGACFHAACAERDGAALLIDAENGSGKTSLLLRLIEHGWRFLADSFTIVDGQLVAHRGLPTMSVRPGTDLFVPWLGEVLQRHPAGIDASGRHSERPYMHPLDWKHRFHVTELPGLRFGDPAPVRAVIFPQVALDEPTSLEVLAPEQARGFLSGNRLPVYGHNLPAIRHERESRAQQFLENTTLIRLVLGRGDPLPELHRVLARGGINVLQTEADLAMRRVPRSDGAPSPHRRVIGGPASSRTDLESGGLGCGRRSRTCSSS